MTRENKLALIVAFALILGVSVLLSDHLSSARTTLAGNVREPTRLPAVPQRPIRTLDDVVRDAQASVVRPDESGLASIEPEPRTASSGRGLGDLLGSMGNAPAAMRAERAPTVREPLDIPGFEPVVLDQRLPRQAPPSRGEASPGPTPGGAAEPVRMHHVVANESLYAIAGRYYGDPSLWRALAAFNADRVRPDGAVNVGVTLRIPSREALTGRAGPAASTTTPTPTPTPSATTPGSTVRPNAPAPATTPPTPRPRDAAPAAPSGTPSRTYTVARGDTLGDISMRNLGTSRRWREIYELNRDRIPNPDNVRAGTVLVLPAS